VNAPRLLGPTWPSTEEVACGEGRPGARRAAPAGSDPRRDSNGNEFFQFQLNIEIWQDFENFYKEI
jgi:hypothetical protein